MTATPRHASLLRVLILSAVAPTVVGFVSLPNAPPLHRPAVRATAVQMYSSVSAEEVAARTARLLAAKEESGLTWDELAAKLGLTNTYTVQLFLGQVRALSCGLHTDGCDLYMFILPSRA